MQNPRRTLVSVFSVVLAASLVVVAPASAATTTPLGTNLVKNPGAQIGDLGQVPYWVTDYAFTTRAYGSGGMPSKNHGNSIGGGSRLFSSGPYDSDFDGCGGAIQIIRIKGRAGAIDSGNLKVKLKARLGTLSTASTARVVIQFLDGNNHTVGSSDLVLGPVSTTKTLVSVSKSKRVPDDTRRLELRLEGNPSEQTCDALFDLVNVQLVSF